MIDIKDMEQWKVQEIQAPCQEANMYDKIVCSSIQVSGSKHSIKFIDLMHYTIKRLQS